MVRRKMKEEARNPTPDGIPLLYNSKSLKEEKDPDKIMAASFEAIPMST